MLQGMTSVEGAVLRGSQPRSATFLKGTTND